MTTKTMIRALALSAVGLAACGSATETINPDASCTWYRDSDQDSYGDPAVTLTQCGDAPAGYVANASDCNDQDATVNPDTAWHPDGDGDGYGAAMTTILQCTKPAGAVRDGRDCDDTNPALNPGTTWYADGDGDGFGVSTDTIMQCTQPAGYALQGGDCDDANRDIKPGTVWHRDADGDGFGDMTMTMTQCARPAGYVVDGTDCNDASADQHPGQTWHLDFDHDGSGHPSITMVSCAPPAGYVLDGRDCNDMDAAVHVGTATCPIAPATVARSCKEILANHQAEGDAAYRIDPDLGGAGQPFSVYCDMTTDGGGWTELLNPATAPTATYPGLAVSWAHVSGTSSSCNANTATAAHNNWYGVNGYDCGNFTNAWTVNWPNAFAATDVRFVAVAEGGTTHTLTINGASIAAEAQSSNATCQFWNGSGLGLPSGVQPPQCTGVWHPTPASVHLHAFTGALNMVFTAGPGCTPDCNYGESFNLYHLAVR